MTLVEIAAKLAGVAIEINVVPDQQSVSGRCERDPALRKCTLAAAGWAAQQDRVAACDGDLDGPLSRLLA